MRLQFAELTACIISRDSNNTTKGVVPRVVGSLHRHQPERRLSFSNSLGKVVREDRKDNVRCCDSEASNCVSWAREIAAR